MQHQTQSKAAIGLVNDETNINTIRFLSVDAVEKAKSGHPGTPMGAAAIMYVLWDRFLKHNPRDPQWMDRDRFVLSAGHASMLLYSLLYLTGYDLSLDDVKAFRQWGSKTPGHPEFGLTPGVEATAGPLGQGFANGVGMAIAERHLSAHFNRPGFEVINHYTYALVSDGDLQEGVASEAASLAGNLKLGKLIYLYDSNDIQQDGPTVSFTEDVAGRFRAYGWNVRGPINGLNIDEVDNAIREAQSQDEKPNLIICKTIIGYGSPHKAGTNASHGEHLGEDEVRLAKEKLGWRYPDPFTVPPEVLDHFRMAVGRGENKQVEWQHLFEAYRGLHPAEAKQLMDAWNARLPQDWDKELVELDRDAKPVSTRDTSGQVMNHIASIVPALIGGAADLAGSTRAYLKTMGDFSPANYTGRNIRYGLREHAMGAISNGMALHGGLVPFAATFFIFLDYLRPALRLAAIMKLGVIYVFTHDSVGLGEDGPTHQPVEHLMSLRAIPDLVMVRPADAIETIAAWIIAVERRHGPTALVFTRQNVPALDRTKTAPNADVQKGGYILWESNSSFKIILIGTGSEVHIALEAGKMLEAKGVSARVVSLPSWALFDSQPIEYRNSVLPPDVKARISIEAGTPTGWEHYVGLEGKAIGVSRFGVSASGETIFEKFGLTPQHVVEEALKLL
jgi:transketolase